MAYSDDQAREDESKKKNRRGPWLLGGFWPLLFIPSLLMTLITSGLLNVSISFNRGGNPSVPLDGLDEFHPVTDLDSSGRVQKITINGHFVGLDELHLHWQRVSNALGSLDRFDRPFSFEKDLANRRRTLTIESYTHLPRRLETVTRYVEHGDEIEEISLSDGYVLRHFIGTDDLLITHKRAQGTRAKMMSLNSPELSQSFREFLIGFKLLDRIESELAPVLKPIEDSAFEKNLELGLSVRYD